MKVEETKKYKELLNAMAEQEYFVALYGEWYSQTINCLFDIERIISSNLDLEIKIENILALVLDVHNLNEMKYNEANSIYQKFLSKNL